MEQRRLDCICEQCGKTFSRVLSQIKISGGKFCSHSCSMTHRYNKTLEEDKKLYNIVYTNSKGFRMVERNCDYCGKNYLAKLTSIKAGTAKFCSNSCKGKGGKIKLDPNPDLAQALKARSDISNAVKTGRLKYTNICKVCGWKKWNSERFHFHHENHKHTMCVIEMCHPCHAKREMMRQRIREWKRDGKTIELLPI